MLKNQQSETRIPRRAVLKAAVASGLATLSSTAGADDHVPSPLTEPGSPMRPYGTPSPRESEAKRIPTPAYPDLMPGIGSSRTPLHLLDGIITPSGLRARWSS
jgi:sulfane dehydrogenase subunit SoxC